MITPGHRTMDRLFTCVKLCDGSRKYANPLNLCLNIRDRRCGRRYCRSMKYQDHYFMQSSLCIYTVSIVHVQSIKWKLFNVGVRPYKGASLFIMYGLNRQYIKRQEVSAMGG